MPSPYDAEACLITYVFFNVFAPSIKCRHIHTHLGRHGCVPDVLPWRFWDDQNSSASAKTCFCSSFVIIACIFDDSKPSFSLEKRHESFIFKRKHFFDLVDNRTPKIFKPSFLNRKATRFLQFQQKMLSQHVFSFKK